MSPHQAGCWRSWCCLTVHLLQHHDDDAARNDDDDNDDDDDNNDDNDDDIYNDVASQFFDNEEIRIYKKHLWWKIDYNDDNNVDDYDDDDSPALCLPAHQSVSEKEEIIIKFSLKL